MDYSELHKAIVGYYMAVKAKRKEQTGTAKAAELAQHLEGKTAAEINALVSEVLKEHLAVTNPHEDSLTSLDMYSKEEIDAMNKGGLVQGLVPFWRIGALNWLPMSVLGNFHTCTQLTATDGSIGDNARFLPMHLEDDGTLAFIRNGTDGKVQYACYGYVPNATTDFKTAYLTERPYTLPDGNTAALVFQGGQDTIAGVLSTGEPFISIKNGTLNGETHKYVKLPANFKDRIAMAETVVVGNQVYILNMPNAHGWMDVSAAATLVYYKIPVSAFDGTTYTPDAVEFVTQTSVGGNVGDPSSAIFFVSKVTFSDSPDATECLWRAASGTVMDNDVKSGWYKKGRPFTTSAVSPDGSVLRTQVSAPVRWKGDGEEHASYAVINVEFNLKTKAIKAEHVDGVLTITPTGFTNGHEANTQMNTWDSLNTFYYESAGSGFYAAIGERSYIGRIATQNKDTLYETLASTFGCYMDFEYAEIEPFFGGPIGERLCTFMPVSTKFGVINTRNNEGMADHVLVKYDTSGDGSPFKNFTTVDGSTAIGFSFGGARTRCAELGDHPSTSDLQPSISYVNNTDIGYQCGYFTPATAFSRASAYGEDMKSKGTITVNQAEVEAIVDSILSTEGFSDVDRKSYELVIPATTNLPALIAVYGFYDDVTKASDIFALYTVNATARTSNVSVSVGKKLYTGNILQNDIVHSITENVEDTTGRYGRISFFGTKDGYGVMWTSSFKFGDGVKSDIRRESRFWLNTNTTVEGYIQRARSEGWNIDYTDDFWGCIYKLGMGGFQSVGYGTTLQFRSIATSKASFLAWTSDTVNNAVRKPTSYTITSQYMTTAPTKLFFREPMDLLVRGYIWHLEPYAYQLENATVTDSSTVKTITLDYSVAEVSKKANFSLITAIGSTSRRQRAGWVKVDSRGIVEIRLYKITRLDGAADAYRPAYICDYPIDTQKGVSYKGTYGYSEGDPLRSAKAKQTLYKV